MWRWMPPPSADNYSPALSAVLFNGLFEEPLDTVDGGHIREFAEAQGLFDTCLQGRRVAVHPHADDSTQEANRVHSRGTSCGEVTGGERDRCDETEHGHECRQVGGGNAE